MAPGLFAAFLASFGLDSRRHLVANSADEKFAALAVAENDLTVTRHDPTKREAT